MSSLSKDVVNNHEVKEADQTESKLAQATATGSSPTVATPLSAVATPFYSMRAPMAVACDLVASANGGGGEDEDEETLTEVRAPRVALGKIMKRVKKNDDGPSSSSPVEPSPSSPFGHGVSPTGGGATTDSNSFEPKSGDAPESASRPVTSINTNSSATAEARSSPLPSSSIAQDKDQAIVPVVKDGPLSGSPVTSTSSNAEVDAYEKARNKILNQTGAVTTQNSSTAQNSSSPSGGQHHGGSDSGPRSEQNNNPANVEGLAGEADTAKRRKMKFRGIVANNEMGDYTRHQPQPHHQPSPYWGNGNGNGQPHQQYPHQVSPYYGAQGPSNLPSSAPSTNVTVGLGHQHINPFVAGRGGGGNNYNNNNNQMNGGRGRGGPSPTAPTPSNAYAQQQQPCYPPNNIQPTVGPYGSIGGIPLTQPLPPPPLPLPTLQQPTVGPAASAPLMPAPFGVPRADPQNACNNSYNSNRNDNHSNSYNRNDPSGQYGGRNGNVTVGSSGGGGPPMPSSSGYGRGGYEQNNNYSYNGRGGHGARGGGYHGYSQQSDAYYPTGSNQPNPNTHGGANPFANQPYQNSHHHQPQYQPPFTQQRPQRMDRGGRRVTPSDATGEVANDSSVGYGNSRPQPAAAW